MKILLVDDHVLFREGVATLLNAQPDMVVLGEAASAKEAVVKARQLKPDIILMDISLPGDDGLEAARQILAEQPEVNIVFLTAHEDDERLFEAIKLGGKGYMLKNTRTADILAMLRGVERGEAAITRRLAARVLSEFARLQSRLEQMGPSQDEDLLLTPREQEILRLVATGASNKQIADQLVLSVSTIKNHIRNIFRKLHLKNRREAVAYARRHGLTPPSARK
ncbi:MAG: DNA-binding response regulator [Caldilineae bacterium]|nr:MAG: DNA-binding response regulator [Caldilineae bacterium]